MNETAEETAAAIDFSRLDRNRVLIGGGAAILLIASVLFFPWFDLTSEGRAADDWLCGTGDTSCTGWETFPILGPLLILSAIAPLILAWILVRGHKLSWAPGEMTMVVGFAAMVLIIYNGILDRPAPEGTEFGIGLSWGYWVALLCSITIAMVGFLRSLESGGRQKRKAPGTV
jgi:hypothetical protein